MKIIRGIKIILIIIAIIFGGLCLFDRVRSRTLRKPVLYLYPEAETNVKVTFADPSRLITVYPAYNDGWHVLVKPNGDMYDANGRYYYALYWEEDNAFVPSFEEGFYVEKENAMSFLESSLNEIGFSEREANEFIMYWLPILESNGKSLVYFRLTEEKQLDNELIIEPKPDSLLRVTMYIKKVNNKVDIKPQQFETLERKGFVAVEWGGAIVE